MPPPPPSDRGSTLLVEECFSSQHAGFIAALRQVRSLKYLASFADRWKQDTRPWARMQIFAYLAEPLNVPGHQPLVRRLFKHAEAQRDDELVAAFAVTFDRLVRRVRRTRYEWDRATRSSYQTEVLTTPRNVISAKEEYTTTDYRGRKVTIKVYPPRNGLLFSFASRFYLRRRAWRYFRRLGFTNPAAYPAAIASALRRYRDVDLASGENILDSWVLLNACFYSTPFDDKPLLFRATHAAVKEGRSLANLSPSPRFPQAWQKPESAPVLLGLIAGAGSHLVRLWAIQLYRRWHIASNVPLDVETFFALLNHDDDQVQQFGAELLSTAEGLGREPVSFWLRLLQTQNLTALATLCEAFKKHVSASRLDLRQTIDLATAKAVPVARLGQHFLTAREIRTEEDRKTLGELAGARCAAVAGELTRWALGFIGTREFYTIDAVSRFFDSLTLETRASAWDWLVAPDSPGYNDSALWSRLTESPFDDLRLRLVDHLELRTSKALKADLTTLWCAVLLGVHRGGRQKAKAVHQIGAAITADPARLDALLPVLAVAVRSVRNPEARAGLAAVVTAVEARPELAAAVHRYLPELDLRITEAAA